MKKKICAAVLLITATLIFIAGCNRTEPDTTIRSQGGVYEVTGMTLQDEHNGSPPSNGGKFLLIEVEGRNADMADMERTFFGKDTTHAHITYDDKKEFCKYIIYSTDASGQNPDISATLVFEVPAGFETKDGRDFVFYSYESNPLALNYKEGGFLSSLFSFFK